MTSLLDIVPQTKMVPIGAVEIECHGITAAGVAKLMERFPGLRELLFPAGASQPSREASDPLALLHAAPETIAAIIAAGTGHPGDKKHEEAAAKLPVEHQIDLFLAVLELTLPGGFVPFVEKAMSVFGVDRQALPSAATPLPNGLSSDEKAPDTSSPSLSNG